SSGHNIVIACLPLGVYGNVFAATVAANILRTTFPSIRFSLMAGIGGVPSMIRIMIFSWVMWWSVACRSWTEYPRIVQYVWLREDSRQRSSYFNKPA
ncbi:hypothetical protein V8E54_001784, partial [Elaphomyces granulatus]